MSRGGEVWVFHDEREPHASYIWLIVSGTSYLNLINLETAQPAFVEARVLDMAFLDDDTHWWERIA